MRINKMLVLSLKLFTWVAFGVILIRLLNQVRLALRGFSLWQRQYKEKFCGTGTESLPRFVLLLPALREQALVKETLNHFLSMDYPPSKMEIIVITTAREEHDLDTVRAAVFDNPGKLTKDQIVKLAKGKLNGDGLASVIHWHQSGSDIIELQSVLANYKTTAEVISEFISNLSEVGAPVRHIEYNGKLQSKAAQLNHAVIEIHEELLNTSTYIGVFDFDSRPDYQSLSVAARAATADSPEALQQLVLPTIVTKSSIGGITDGLLHLLRSFGNEFAVWRKEAQWNDKRGIRWLDSDLYFVGVGLYVRSDSLLTCGGFRHPVDDITLGFEAARRAWKVAVISLPCRTEAYPTLRAAVKSRRLVYAAYFRGLLEFIKNPWWNWLRFGTLCEGVMWPLTPVILVSSIISMALLHEPLAAMTACLLYGLVCLVRISVARALFYKLEIRTAPCSLLNTWLFSLFEAFWRGASAWRGIGVLLLRREFAKTER